MKDYSYKEAYEASLKYFNGEDLPAKVVVDKYLLKNDDGKYLEKDPDDKFKRIANEFARIEKNKFKNPLTFQEIFDYLSNYNKIVCQGSPMFGIANPYQSVTLSNCYVISSPADSYGGICKTDEELVQISKRRGGVGIDISNIRPVNMTVKNAARTSTGIIPFMERYSHSIREVGQGGRRGALMITISVHHPEVLEFARVKSDLKRVTGANISIKLTDEFLNCVKKDNEYQQRWPVDSKTPKITKMVKAREVWEEIIKQAHATAEPGLLFWDNIIKESPADCYSEFGYKTMSTNPCQPAWAKVLTKNGIRTLSDVNIGDEIWSETGWTKIVNKWSNGTKDVYEYKTCCNAVFYGTENHKVIEYGKKVEVKDAEFIDCFIEKSQYGCWNNPALNSLETIPSKIIKKSIISHEEVFDITVDNASHTYWTQGCNVSNCSELPLSEFDSCRLMLLNTYAYVKNPFTKEALFDFDSFYKDSGVLQRLLDDLIDLEIECIDKIISKITKDPEAENIKKRELEIWTNIRESCLNGRRTGSGITGLGDVFAALNIKYGSEESIRLTENIYRTLKIGCYRSSVDMAKELGSFPVWNHSLERDNPFLLRIKKENKELWEDMKEYGRRNIALLTTAPAGSVSILTQTTSGIEPLFMISYKRRKKINHSDKNSRVDFIDDNGDSWQEFEVYHPKVKEWMKITGETDITKSPWYGCCAEDLLWTDRVKLQSVAQRHIDHAISSTINLPENVSVDKVSEIYESAWQSGCKGITVYRKNCRSGVLLETPKIKITQTTAPKRPVELLANVQHFTRKGHRYYVIIGILNEQPYEVFCASNHDSDGEIIIPKNVKHGIVNKKSRGNYYLFNKETNKEYHLTNGHTDDTIDALTRLMSLGLRHGASIDFVCHQLEKVSGEMNSISRMIARALKVFIPDNTKVYGEECPECKGQLIRQNGCVSCTCGFSRCL